MAVLVKRPRPTTVTAIALGALALGLGLWWLSEVVDGPESDRDEPSDVEPTYLAADESEPAPAPAPTLEPPKRPAGAKPPPRRGPPEPIVPADAGPSGGDFGGARGRDAPARREKPRERGVVGDFRRGTDIDWRSGAVGQTDATATREVLVPEGTAWIGTPLRWVQGLAGQRGFSTYPALRYEAPRHTRRMHSYFIDRFEVKNHDYLRYLQTTATVIYDTSDHEPRTLVEIAFALILDPPINLDYEDVVAWQLFQANKRVLLDVFKDAVMASEGIVDEEKTFLRLRDRIVPGNVRLTFFDKAPPGTWPSNIYRDKRGGNPVRDISFEEALGFAHFDGRHIPDEFEWEYAARGPKGLDYPWGARADGLEERINGGRVFGRDERPDTVNVTYRPEGASWIGCFNMLGNVSEWTSSFLVPYPDATPGAVPAPGRNLVIRGGSAHDEDPLLLRSAYRGWPKGEPKGGPIPMRRLPWTGFRTARYEAVAFSRTVAMHYFARRGGQMLPELLEPDIYDGWQGIQVEHFRRQFADGRTRPGVKSLVVQPLREVAVRLAGESLHHANTSDKLTTVETLRALSYASPVLVGLFQNDLHLTSTWHFLRAGSNSLRRARCPPGTWYVALFQGRLCLIQPDFGDVFFVTNREAPKSVFNVRAVRSRSGGRTAVPQATLRYNPGKGPVQARFQAQIFQKDKQTWLVNIDLRAGVDEQEAVVVRGWERGMRTERRP